MLVHLRRSVIFAIVVIVFFGFVYAFAGTGVAQLLFKHQADGSITANGSTLIGQNWSADEVPGPPARAAACSRDAPTTSGPTPDSARSPSPAGQPVDDHNIPGQRRPTPASRGRPTSGPARRTA